MKVVESKEEAGGMVLEQEVEGMVRKQEAEGMEWKQEAEGMVLKKEVEGTVRKQEAEEALQEPEQEADGKELVEMHEGKLGLEQEKDDLLEKLKKQVEHLNNQIEQLKKKVEEECFGGQLNKKRNKEAEHEYLKKTAVPHKLQTLKDSSLKEKSMEEQVETVSSEISQYIVRGKLGEPYTCLICKNFSNQAKVNVWKHIESVHFPQTFEYYCAKCERKFGTKRSFENHIHKSRLLSKPCLAKNCITTLSSERKEEVFILQKDGKKSTFLDSEGNKVAISQFEEFDRFMRKKGDCLLVPYVSIRPEKSII